MKHFVVSLHKALCYYLYKCVILVICFFPPLPLSLLVLLSLKMLHLTYCSPDHVLAGVRRASDIK